MATAVTPKVFKNYIDGEWIPARSGKAIEDRNPANTGELVGMFPASSADDVDAAMTPRAGLQNSAPDAHAESRRDSPRGRDSYPAQRRFRDRHDARNGQSARRNARRRAGSHRHDLPNGWRRPSPIRPDHSVRAAQQICNVRALANGVAGLITPWNFPMAIPSWKAIPALVSGNPVVIKPGRTRRFQLTT